MTLADYLRRGPVLLVMLRGLYCPYCRRHISQLRPACEALRASGIALLGVLVVSPERARRYFNHFPACFPMAAAPDHAVHQAYGLPELAKTAEWAEESERRASEILREQGIEAPLGRARSTFRTSDGIELTPEDQARQNRATSYAIGHFLISRDGLIRWARVDPLMVPLPDAKELSSLV